jgi:hypothetical protein
MNALSITRRRVRRRAKRALETIGLQVTHVDRRYVQPSYNDQTPLPPGAREYLVADNPRLRELQRAYDALAIPVTVPSQWKGKFVNSDVTLPWFRGDNAYVWQFRELGYAADAKMYLTLLDVQAGDSLSLLDTLREDGLFGVWTFQFGDRALVSRDLLDSIGELNYLERHIGLRDRDDLSVLDIGAGYGRLAHRAAEALPNLRGYDCIDSIALSTFLCEYYIAQRGVDDRFRVVPLHEHDKLAPRYTVAVNIHSFSECTLATIRWWLAQVAARDVEYLFVVSNSTRLISKEADGRRLDFFPAIMGAGYELIDDSPYVSSDEIRPLIGSSSRCRLFRRKY